MLSTQAIAFSSSKFPESPNADRFRAPVWFRAGHPGRFERRTTTP